MTDPGAAPQHADFAAETAKLRQELLDRHEGMDGDSKQDLDAALVWVLRLTGEVLDREGLTQEAREALARRRSSNVGVAVGIVLGLSAVVLFVAGILIHALMSSWGVVGCVTVLLMSAFLLWLHLSGPAIDPVFMLRPALIVLSAGVFLLVPASGLLPWWADLLLISAAVAAVFGFLYAARPSDGT